MIADSCLALKMRADAAGVTITMSQEQPTPSNVWETTFQLDRRLVKGIQKAGFVDPMPIQTATIPAAREGQDVMGLAQTGTGKPAAFALHSNFPAAFPQKPSLSQIYYIRYKLVMEHLLHLQ